MKNWHHSDCATQRFDSPMARCDCDAQTREVAAADQKARLEKACVEHTVKHLRRLAKRYSSRALANRGFHIGATYSAVADALRSEAKKLQKGVKHA